MKIQKVTIEQQIEIKNLIQQNKLMKQLATRRGFFEQFFQALKQSETKDQAFRKVNDLYFKLFGKYRYNNFEQFAQLSPNF